MLWRLSYVEDAFWLVLAIVVVYGIARGFWLYRASLTWPTADGVITRLDVERVNDPGRGGGHYYRATFTYDFRDPRGNRVSGNCANGAWMRSQADRRAKMANPFLGGSSPPPNGSIDAMHGQLRLNGLPSGAAICSSRSRSFSEPARTNSSSPGRITMSRRTSIPSAAGGRIPRRR